ncbi:hypothetical protein [Nocardia mangyaensis]|uniref:hypothetical protein n=1 Tax=Nocardia mangyaensis TaxID=2213200 RepID=UPI0026773135|nr:hypothetical protein [Nocardia mangyaensis]MDO3651210.1 hypothetical protein [Nocardia mangyaensis]
MTRLALFPFKGSRVPLPAWRDAWGKPRPAVQTIAATSFFAIVTLVFIPFSVQAAESGNWTRMIFGTLAILVGITFVAAAVPHLRARRKRIPRNVLAEGADHEILGLRFRLVQHWRVTLLAWLGIGLMFMAARAALSLEQLLAGSDQDQGSRAAFDALAVAISVAGAGLLAFLLVWLVFRTGGNSLTISKDGLVRRTGAVTVSAPWESVDQVLARVVNNVNSVSVTSFAGEELKFRVQHDKGGRHDGSTVGEITLPAISFGLDPALLLCIISYYKEHPENRYELESDHVLERIKSGRLVDLEPA